jgi:hypothetical protein
MNTQPREEQTPERKTIARPTLTRGGRLPVITAGSGDLGTPQNGIID